MTAEEINNRALKQVLSIEQIKTLKRLGVNTDNAFWSWTRVVTDIAGVPISKPWKLILNEPIAISNSEDYERVPTFSLPEILELLPSKIEKADLCIVFDMDHWTMSYIDYSACKILARSVGLKLIGVAYEMLYWLADNDKYRSYITNK